MTAGGTFRNDPDHFVPPRPMAKMAHGEGGPWRRWPMTKTATTSARPAIPARGSIRPSPTVGRMGTDEAALFALSESRAFGEAMAAHLGLGLARHEERHFDDGEHKIRPLETVRGRDAYIVQSLHGDPCLSGNDKLCRLLFFAATLRDAGARQVTLVTPYLCYARKDRRTKSRDPVTTRYVAQLVEAMGADAIVTIDVHNLAAFQNAFRCPTVHLEAAGLFARHFAARESDAPLVVASPDVGGIKRAESFRLVLEAASGQPCG